MLGHNHILSKFQLNKNNKILYTNGCSLTYGTDSVDDQSKWKDHSWPAYLSSRLEYQCVNNAVENCSNQSILRRSLHDLENNDYNLAVIGWTNQNRFEIDLGQPVAMTDGKYKFSAQGDTFVQCTVWGLENKIYSNIPFLTEQVQDGFDKIDFQEITEDCISNLDEYAKRTDQRIYMFNGYEQVGKDHMLVDVDFFHHVIKQGYKLTESNHFTKDANQYWANILYTHLTKYGGMLL